MSSEDFSGSGSFSADSADEAVLRGLAGDSSDDDAMPIINKNPKNLKQVPVKKQQGKAAQEPIAKARGNQVQAAPQQKRAREAALAPKRTGFS